MKEDKNAKSIYSPGVSTKERDLSKRNSHSDKHETVENKAALVDTKLVRSPNQSDVIFGRGKGYQQLLGNQRMRRIVEKHKDQYHSMKRSQKRAFVQMVHREIVEDGARFLMKDTDDDVYLVVDEDLAIQKVSNSLRCKKRERRALMAAVQKAAAQSNGVTRAADTSRRKPASTICVQNDERRDSLPRKMDNLDTSNSTITEESAVSNATLPQAISTSQQSILDAYLQQSLDLHVSHVQSPMHHQILSRQMFYQPASSFHPLLRNVWQQQQLEMDYLNAIQRER